MIHEVNSRGWLLQEPCQAPTGAGQTSAASALSDDLHALRAVVEGTAAGIGQEFFRSLVRHLAEAIAVPYATVCEFQAPPKGRVLAICERSNPYSASPPAISSAKSEPFRRWNYWAMSAPAQCSANGPRGHRVLA
jgi:hypothetical protein